MKKYTNTQKKFMKEWTVHVLYRAGGYDFCWRRTQIPQLSWDTRTFGTAITPSPTKNCQMMAACSFEGLIMDDDPTIEEIDHEKNELKLYSFMGEEIAKLIYGITYNDWSSKEMLLLDTMEVKQKKVRKIIKGITRFNPSTTFVYTSANNTRMRTSMVRLNPTKYAPDMEERKKLFHDVVSYDDESTRGYGVWKLVPKT